MKYTEDLVHASGEKQSRIKSPWSAQAVFLSRPPLAPVDPECPARLWFVIEHLIDRFQVLSQLYGRAARVFGFTRYCV